MNDRLKKLLLGSAVAAGISAIGSVPAAVAKPPTAATVQKLKAHDLASELNVAQLSLNRKAHAHGEEETLDPESSAYNL